MLWRKEGGSLAAGSGRLVVRGGGVGTMVQPRASTCNDFVCVTATVTCDRERKREREREAGTACICLQDVSCFRVSSPPGKEGLP